jgi:hypothetical protein
MTKIVNLYGGPGSGKSTTAAALFAEMKNQGINCELVTEYAKELVWEQSNCKLDDQLYIFAKQYRRISRLLGRVDYVVTDAPILNSLVYGVTTDTFKDLVRETYASMDNIDVFLRRVKVYNPAGRQQTEGQARDLDQDIELILNDIADLHYVNGDRSAIPPLMELIGHVTE